MKYKKKDKPAQDCELETKNNYLTSKSHTYFKPLKSGQRATYIDCECVCGKLVPIRYIDFRDGHYKSCGCKKNELINKGRRKGTAVEGGMKKCAKCLQTREIKNYFKNKLLGDGYAHWCIRCQKNNSFLKTYNITYDDYERMIREQDGKCGCCGKGDPNHFNAEISHFNIDHCHKTGKIRGLLCFRCNTAIGKLGDDSEGVYKAYLYLKKFEDEFSISND